jgi:glycosyltransferase involved in cell wall biosynthesis
VAEPGRGLTVRPLVVDLGRDYRGGQHQALLLLRGLAARGYSPSLITLRGSLLAERAMQAGIPVYGVERRRSRPAAVLEIRRLLRGVKSGVVHANEPHALTAAWLAGAHRRVPLVVSRRIALPLSPGSISRARYRAATRIVAISYFVRESVLASGLPSDAVEVIYDGVELPAPFSDQQRRRARARHAIPEDRICLGNVAALVPEKGQAMLIRAIAELRAKFPQCVALFAGEGPEQGNLQNLARRLGLGGAIKFSGFVPDVESVYAATDVFVFPSHQEPLGSALLMAMGYGLPVVAVGRGGVPEVVEHGKNGLLIRGLDPSALASGIACLLADPVATERLGQAARGTIASGFSAEKMVGVTLRLYQRLADFPDAFRSGHRAPA